MKNYFLAILSGTLLALSWPTYGFSLLIFFAFIPLLFAEKNIRLNNKKTKLKTFILSYLAFIIWNVTSTGWLYYADLTGMLFANLVNSLLMSVVFLLYHLTAKKHSENLSLFFLASLWISFEYLHLHWDFSWPWLNLGHVFSEDIKYIQWYEFTGVFGGSLWVLIVNLFIFKYIKLNENFKFNFKRITPLFALFIGIPIIISLWMYNTEITNGTKKEVIVLQPNVDPYTEKYKYTNETILDLLLEETNKVITDSTEFIIAPETVFAENLPMNYFKNSRIPYRIKAYIENNPKAQFLVGIDTYDLLSDPSEITPYSNQLRDDLWGNFYNMAIFFNKDYDFQQYYKSKLVVGIENFPFKPILEPLIGNLMLDLGGTISTKTIQKERSVFIANDNTKVAPVICYESVYGEYVTDYVKNGAQFLAIITNDAWWEETQGHKQHLSLAKLRAIETRRDIARSANTGISAFINQKGEIISQTKYNEKTALKGNVLLNNDITFYVKFGDYIAKIALISVIGVLIFIILKKLKH